MIKQETGKKRWLLMICSVAVGVLLAVAAAWLILQKTRQITAADADYSLHSVFSTASSEMLSDASELPPTPVSAAESAPTVRPLTVTSPKAAKSNVTDSHFTFTGNCDPAVVLTLNGQAVACDAAGEFSVEVSLAVGNNTFTFEYNGTKTVYTVYYRYVIIHAYSPSTAQTVDGGSQLYVTAAANAGATVTATFRGETLTLQQSALEGDETGTLLNFYGSFQIPAATSDDQNFGKVCFCGSENGISESFYSGDITCSKIYIPKIAEVVSFGAETFDGNSADNCTRPTNNYLPQGTVDYVTGTFSGTDGKYLNHFVVLQCGRRIYADMPLSGNVRRVTVSKIYEGYLPDHNELSVAGIAVGEKLTTVTLNTLYKAPFFLDYLPQAYADAAAQNYAVSAFTAQYIEIKFCYATVFSGELAFSAEHPLFSSAQVIPADGCTIVRLFLKNAGKFYGWDCYYNDAGQLVFEFRHPVRVSATADNEYGWDLTGAVIAVDAGHGGKDSGAIGAGNIFESTRNLILANMIREELESTGATVKMTRTDDSTLESPERIAVYRSIKPDFLVTVHHDSSTKSTLSGLGIFYGTPFSVSAANAIYNHSYNTGLYTGGTFNRIAWHYFYMCRMTYCPSVLTENGYMSNAGDLSNIVNDEANRAKAKAIVRGIAEYFAAQGS